MIYKNKKELIAEAHGELQVIAVYKGTQLVWRAVHSCFGSGGWDNNEPWDNGDGWTNK